MLPEDGKREAGAGFTLPPFDYNTFSHFK